MIEENTTTNTIEFAENWMFPVMPEWANIGRIVIEKVNDGINATVHEKSGHSFKVRFNPDEHPEIMQKISELGDAMLTLVKCIYGKLSTDGSYVMDYCDKYKALRACLKSVGGQT